MKWSALWILGVLTVLINNISHKQETRVYFFLIYLLKSKLNLFRIHPTESRAFVKQTSETVTLWAPWHKPTHRLRHANRTTAGSWETSEESARIRCHCYQRAKRKRKREKGRTGAEQRGAFRKTCWGTTHIDIIRYVQSCDSLQAERQRIEKVRSSAERSTMLGEVSMLAAQRNFTGSSRHRDHM